MSAKFVKDENTRTQGHLEDVKRHHGDESAAPREQGLHIR